MFLGFDVKRVCLGGFTPTSLNQVEGSTLSMERLLVKLKAHSITDYVHAWIRSWLTDRKQRVVLNGHMSPWEAVLSGVPQGSVLGPCLFVIFINDINNSAAVSIISKFADDTKLGQTILGPEDIILLQESNLIDWSVKWGMKFNTSKCKVMHVGKSNLTPWRSEYEMNGVKLLKVDQRKILE